MKQVAVYSKKGCPFCSLLKTELQRRNIPFTEIDLSDDAERQAFYRSCGEGVNSVPQLFLTDQPFTATEPSGERLGGWSEVAGTLDRLDRSTF